MLDVTRLVKGMWVHGKVGCDWLPESRERRGLRSMATIAVATAAPGTCWKSLLKLKGRNCCMTVCSDMQMCGWGGDKDEFF